MVSIDNPAKRQQRSARFDGLLVLEPPRHSYLPLSFLGPGKHLIGTGNDCAIRLENDGVESRHAMILVGDQVIMLKALDSRTWVNDSAVTEIALRTGDRLSIGPITFRLRLATADELQNHAFTQVDDQSLGSIHPTRTRLPNPPSPISPPEISSTFGDAVFQEHEYETTDRGAKISIPVETRSEPVLSAERKPAADVLSNETQFDLRKKFLPRPRAETVPADDLQQSPRTPPTDSKVDEIQRQIAELNSETEVFQETRESSRHIEEKRNLAQEKQRLAAREDDLRRLADELARQSTRLRDRNDHISKREEELDRKYAQAAAENERIVATAETTRRELSEEYARQMELWQEWDAAYRRTAEELKIQLETVEQRRSAIQAENEKIVGQRAEIQQLHAEYDRQRSAAAAERIQAASELGHLHAQRAAFETERRQHFVNLQEREAQVANDRHSLAARQDELLAARQHIEHDRTLFATERSSESLRREQEVREQTEKRIRLNDEETELQSMRLELEAARRSLDTQRTDFERENAQFEIARAETNELRARLCNAEGDLEELRRSHHEKQVRLEVADEEVSRQGEELRKSQRSIELQKLDLDALRDRVQLEQNALIAAREELDALRAAAEIQSAELASHRPMPENDSTTTSAVDHLLGISSLERAAESSSSSSNFGLVTPQKSDSETAMGLSVNRSELTSTLPETAPTSDWSRSSLSQNSAAGDFENSSLVGQRPHDPMFSAVPPVMSSEPESTRSESTFATLTEGYFDGGLPIAADARLSPETNPAAMALEFNSIDDTLLDVSQRYGFVESQTSDNVVTDHSSRADSADGVFNENYNPRLSIFDSSVDETSTTEAADHVSEAGGDSIGSLRAQLAQMFSLSDEFTSNEDKPTEPESMIPEDIEGDHDGHMMEGRNGPESSELDDTPIDYSSESETIADSPDEPVEEQNAEEDEWTRRLRELAKVAQPEAVRVPSASVQTTQPATDDDEEFSVDAQLARLLGRSMGGSTGRQTNPVPVESHPATTESGAPQETAYQPSSENESAEISRTHDRSHLTSEPKHKQNKNAVREEVQSFRAVAQMSARTALAKHSWNNLKSEVYFTACVTAASTIAALWYLGSYFYGTEKEIWKGITCSLATAVCGPKLIRSSVQLKQCLGTNTKRSGSDTAQVLRKEKTELQAPTDESQTT